VFSIGWWLRMEQTQKEFKTIDDLQCEGKTVLVRVDINSVWIPETNKIEDNDRFKAHAETIKELANKKAKVVVIGHQGRAVDPDFTILEQHAEILSKHIRKKVKYVSDIFGKTAQNEIKKLQPGKIILLENARFLAEETTLTRNYEKTIFVRTLAPLCDAYVNDAFSAAHRAQTSLMGFPKLLPSYAGRTMEREYRAVAKVVKNIEHPNVYLVGGLKPEEVLSLMSYALENKVVDHVLTSGVVGEMFLIAKGNNLGATEDWLKGEKFYEPNMPIIKELIQKFEQKIEVPSDFAFADDDGIRTEVPLQQLPRITKPIFDVGSATAKRYSDYVKQAKTVYVKGPLGKYEEPQYELGTKIVFQALEKTHAFVLMGGGHTLTAIDKFGINRKKIGHISLAGGALSDMLQGKPLPAVEALKQPHEMQVQP